MTGPAFEIRDPRCTLLEAATPLQRLSRLEAGMGRCGLYIKRDDHMPIALGGNKLRSLEFWLGAARHAGADTVIVAGGAASNLCRLTAAAAAMTGFGCMVLHNACDTASNRQKSFLNRIFGAEVRFLGEIDEQQRSAAAREAAQDLQSRGRVPYVIGDEVVGALGYVIAAFELHAQSLRLEQSIKHVFLPGSMGPTEAGLIFGNALLGNPFDIHLVSVEYARDELIAHLRRIHAGLQAHTGFRTAALDALPIHYHMDHLGSGYGHRSDEAEAALLALARTEGILMEHVYTAKTLAGFLDQVEKRRLPDDEPACIIHTGGVPALFSQFDMFGMADEKAPLDL